MITEPFDENLAAQEQAQVDAIVSRGPAGALALAGTAVVLVLAMWIVFYVVVFLPRT